ncbi:ALP1-like protein [Tanacetum coccineum]
MNQNRTVFDIDEETDAFYLQKAVEYHEWLIQQEAQPRLTRTPIFRDREDAERRLRADYFDDHYYTGRIVISALMKCTEKLPYANAYEYSTPDAFDEYLQMSQCHGKVNTVEVIKKYPTIMLEAVLARFYGFGIRFIGMTGANNDINVLDNSPLFDDLLDDLAPVVHVRQESARKDVERAFGVLQGRWGLIQQPARAYDSQ